MTFSDQDAIAVDLGSLFEAAERCLAVESMLAYVIDQLHANEVHIARADYEAWRDRTRGGHVHDLNSDEDGDYDLTVHFVPADYDGPDSLGRPFQPTTYTGTGRIDRWTGPSVTLDEDGSSDILL